MTFFIVKNVMWSVNTEHSYEKDQLTLYLLEYGIGSPWKCLEYSIGLNNAQASRKHTIPR